MVNGMDRLDAYIQGLGRGGLVFPGQAAMRCGMPIRDAYDALEDLSSQGALTQCLAVPCPECRGFTGLVYDTIAEVPDAALCPHCKTAVPYPLGKAIVIYRKGARG